MKKTTVILLFGGPGEEHDISLLSAEAVLDAFTQTPFTVYPVGITKEGTPYYYRGPFNRIAGGEWEKDRETLSPVRFSQGWVSIKGQKAFLPDTVFPMLHGAYGEDGRLQGMLECLGLPYVGCGCLCSALCMHKHFAKLQFVQSGIPTAKWMRIFPHDLSRIKDLYQSIESAFGGYSLFIKPATGGSSVGASAITEQRELLPALEKAFRFGKEVLVEERVFGTECEVGVLCDYETVVTEPASVSTHRPFYDYQAKYQETDTRLLVPAPLPKEVAEQMQRYAKTAFFALGCRHLARFDFFYTKDGKVLLSEVNTMPGMTERSLYPAMMQHSGIPFPLLLKRLVEAAER